VGRHDAVAVIGGEVGSVVADDGALALHHGGEREREVSGGRERQERGAASGSLSG
jgi:hypothetical protein